MKQDDGGQGMAQARRLSQEDRERIARRYADGDAIEDIMADESISRATIYYTLDKMSVPRDRQPRAEVPDSVGDSPQQTLAWALRQLLIQQEEIGRLREQLSQKDHALNYLVDCLGPDERNVQ